MGDSKQDKREKLEGTTRKKLETKRVDYPSGVN